MSHTRFLSTLSMIITCLAEVVLGQGQDTKPSPVTPPSTPSQNAKVDSFREIMEKAAASIKELQVRFRKTAEEIEKKEGWEKLSPDEVERARSELAGIVTATKDVAKDVFDREPEIRDHIEGLNKDIARQEIQFEERLKGIQGETERIKKDRRLEQQDKEEAIRQLDELRKAVEITREEAKKWSQNHQSLIRILDRCFARIETNLKILELQEEILTKGTNVPAALRMLQGLVEELQKLTLDLTDSTQKAVTSPVPRT